MNKPCCAYSPKVYQQGRWVCSECGSIGELEVSKLLDEFTEWQLTSGVFKGEKEKTCECGAFKTYGKDCIGHSSWCPLYKKP